MISNKIKNAGDLIQNGGFTFFSCLLSVIIIPVKVDFLPPVMILWVISWMIENHQRFNQIWDLKNPVVLLFIGFALYFVWYMTGLIYTEDLLNGELLIFRRLSFILLPFVLIYPGGFIKKRTGLIIKVFCLSTLAYILFSLIFAFIRSVYISNGSITFNPHPPEFDYENYFFGTQFAFSQHPSYLAMYVVFSIFIAFESFFDSNQKLICRIFWILSILTFLSSLYLLSSRAGILSVLILIPVYLFFKFKKIKKWWIPFIILAVAGSSLVFLFLNNERLKYYFPEVSETSLAEKVMLDNRIPIWKSSIEVIKEHILLGVGAGDASHQLQKKYLKNGYTEAYYNNLNAHNQYLEVLIGTGLIGFLIFVSILAYMITRMIITRNLLFGMFILNVLIFFLFESILNRIAGITFFSLFSFLLLLNAEGNTPDLRENEINYNSRQKEIH
jgi:O-antigen ligase